METLNCILTRRSVRAFRKEKLSSECIESIIEHARFSPSWANTKTVRYTCITDEKMKSLVAQHCYGKNAEIIRNVPHLMVLSAVKGRSGWGSVNHSSAEWMMFDSGLAAQTFCLAAWEMGIASIILGAFLPEISQVIGLPEEEELVTLIPFGYPAESPQPPRRKAVSEILRVI